MIEDNRSIAAVIFGSVCSGIEAASVAWCGQPLNWCAAWFAEIDPFPSAVLAHHYPEIENLGDFTAIGPERAGIDVLVGGTPCQSFSVAGLRGGMGDARGNLALGFLQLAGRLRPRWVVWENVFGVLSSISHDAPDHRPPDIDLDSDNAPRDGEEVVVEDEYDADESHAFACFLAGLSELGYGFAYRVLDAQHFGVPQRRRRVFVVGYLGDWRRAAAVLFECHSLSRNSPPSRATREGATGGVAACLNSGGNNGGFRTEPGEHLIHEGGSVSGRNFRGVPGTDGLTARTLTGSQQRLDGTVETLIVSADSPPVFHTTGAGFWQEGCGTLRSRAQESHEHLTIAYQRQGTNVGPMGTLRKGDGGMTSGVPLVCEPVAFDYGVSITSNSNGWYERSGATASDQCQTLKKSDGHTPAVHFDSIVRRLTPIECERLMGLPDNYTLVQYRGKPASDGPRYKAIGNSMAEPCMRWIGVRIAMVEALPRSEPRSDTDNQER